MKKNIKKSSFIQRLFLSILIVAFSFQPVSLFGSDFVSRFGSVPIVVDDESPIDQFESNEDFEYDEHHRELESFYCDLEEQLIALEEKINVLVEAFRSQHIIPSQIRKVELEAAIQTLEVKKTLIRNFINTPSILIAEIREKLLEILEKERLEEVDLLELQALVEEYQL